MRNFLAGVIGPSEAIHSDPRALDPLGQLADVDLILLGGVSPLRDLRAPEGSLRGYKIFISS